MNTIQILSMKAAAAATRLAELERKKDRPSADASRLTGVALRELQGSVEALRVAIDHLHEVSAGLAAARQEAQVTGKRYDELLDAMPVACLFTDEDGIVSSANEAAARLLNISARHLAGKPLLLFVADRKHFASLLRASCADGEAMAAQLTLRPRDRKSRVVAAHVRYLSRHERRSWFFFTAEDSLPSDPR